MSVLEIAIDPHDHLDGAIAIGRLAGVDRGHADGVHVAHVDAIEGDRRAEGQAINLRQIGNQAIFGDPKRRCR